MGSKLLHNPETAPAGGIELETTELELLLERPFIWCSAMTSGSTPARQ